MKYAYPAILTHDTKENCYHIKFPDIEGCYSDGKSASEAIEMGEDVLCSMLYNMEERKVTIPPASKVNSISHDDEDVVTMVICDTREYRFFQ